MKDKDFGLMVHINSSGYGFLRPDGADRDLFVHISELMGDIRIGDRVCFSTGDDRRGRPCAKDVRHSDGEK
jgi:cold shock CspA family protein